jgi:cobalt-zinc-cadmium efflux system outer membrane protein
LILILLLSTEVYTLSAQERRDTAGNVSQLSMKQAVALAIENNLELKSLRESLGIARGQLTGARIFPTNPELEFTYFNADPSERVGRISEYSLSLSQEFEIGGQRGHRKRAAQSTIEKVEAEIGRAQWMLVGDVRDVFYQVLLQQEKLNLADRVISLSEDLVSLTGGRFAAGYAPEFEVNFAKLELQRALREKARVINQLKVAKYRLNNLAGRPWETAFTSAGELSYQSPEIEIEKLKAYAVKNRRDLKSLQFEQQGAQSEIDLARSLKIPNLRFSLLYNKEFDKNNFGAVFSLPIKLFNRNQGDIAMSLASERTAAARYSFLKFLIEKEVGSAYSEVLLASKEVQLLEEGMLETAEQNMDLVQEAYQRGEVEIIEVITAQRNFVDIQTAYLEALYNFNLAIVNLEKVLGGDLVDIRE